MTPSTCDPVHPDVLAGLAETGPSTSDTDRSVRYNDATTSTR